jgi:transcriptional regulator with GAF, ATPase, and Fis domain
MERVNSDFYKVLFDDLDPENMVKRFLELLLKLQNVERGSIWVKRGDEYHCIESLGGASETENIKNAVISSKQKSIVRWVMENSEMTIAEAGKDPRHFREFENRMRQKSVLIIAFPLILKNGTVYGVVEIIDTSAKGKRLNLDERYLKLLKGIIDTGAIALSNALNYREQLEKNQDLEHAIELMRGNVQVIGQSPSFLMAMKSVRDYAKTDFPVLITGESGTGKDLIAAAIHNLSSRKDMPFVVQNCSAIPDTLLESELFGYKKGAFTGATEDKVGLLQAADNGTVFLDEIGDMPAPLQARILRVIQNGEIKPLGETRSKKINVRIISATNKDLVNAVAKKEFREDLFYRLNVLPIHLPPLRERKNDIPLLLNYFMKKESLNMGIPVKKISHKALAYLGNYTWQGNIRELENFVKYVLSTTENTVVDENDIPNHFKKRGITDEGNELVYEEAASSVGKLDQKAIEFSFSGYSWNGLEREYVKYLLNRFNWNITRAAKEAGVNRSTFNSRMRRLGINKAINVNLPEPITKIQKHQ